MSQLKQLKKAEFLAAVPETPVSRGQLVDSLAEYSFLPSWLDYLIDHFKTAGKITVDGNGNICRKTKAVKTKGPRMAYEADLESKTIVERELADGEEMADYESATKIGAVKKASAALYTAYKQGLEVIKALKAQTK